MEIICVEIRFLHNSRVLLTAIHAVDFEVMTSTLQNIDSNGDIAGMIMQMNNNVSARLGMIENSLSKLRTIENEVSLVQADVSNIKTNNTEFNRRLTEVDNITKSTDTNMQKNLPVTAGK